MPQQDALHSVLVQVGLAISPLKAINNSELAIAFFNQLGYDIPLSVVGSSLPKLAVNSSELINFARELADANDETAIIEAVSKIVANILSTLGQINELHKEIQLAGGAGIPNIIDFPRRLTDFLLLNYLEKKLPQFHELLHLLGLIENEEISLSGQASRIINWERFGQFFSEPSSIANDVYQWDTDFDTSKFLIRLHSFMRAANMAGGLYLQSNTIQSLLGNETNNLQELRFPIFQKGVTSETYSQFGLTFSPVEAQNGKMKGIALLPYIMGGTNFDFAVCDRGELIYKSSADIKDIGLVVRPPFNAEGILNSIGSFRTSITIKEKQESNPEIVLIGSLGGTRLAVQGLGIEWFAQSQSEKLNFGVMGKIQALRLVIGGGDGDGFLQKILSNLHIQAEAELGFGISLLTGFLLQGGAKFAIELNTHIDLGSVKIEGLRIALSPEKSRFMLEMGTHLRFDFGPLKAIVEDIGLKTELNFKQGNLGSLDLDVGFKPPNGLGLSINAGAVIGGGYLFFNYEKEEYAGAMELTIAGFISAKAIGLITTKMPDGSKGFSMLIIITAEFMPAFQLGFGFTLMGVGGLLGLNRTVRIDPLRDSVRTGAVNNILFPQNVIANAPRIISDLNTIFPAYEGKFLIGPMAKIGWGTPTLINLSLGLIIEIPGNIAILGVLKITLPEERLPLVKIQIAFVGIIDFDKKMFSFDASLYESSILTFTLEGDMAVRLKWGDSPDFLLTVGGFHPSFTPPPLSLPTLRRLAVSILNESYAKIRIECYLAVTSNTVQFGAKAELFFGLSECSINGYIGFDALFQFNPFYFIIDLSAGFSLSAFGMDVMSVRVKMSLEGPTPWTAKGTGSISLFFFDISADFNETWGDSKKVSLPDIAILPRFIEEIGKNQNWSTALSTDKNTSVTLRKFKESENIVTADVSTLIMHPSGSLIVQQKILPLNINIVKIGNQKTSDVKRINVITASSNNVPLSVKEIKESFAIGQYQELSNAEKLSKPSFQKETGGVEITLDGNTVTHGKMVRKALAYELTIIDKEPVKPFVLGLFYIEIVAFFTNFLRGNSISKSTMSKSYNDKLQPAVEKIKFKEEGYSIVNQSDNKLFEGMQFNSEMAAFSSYQDILTKYPSMKNELQVVPNFELQES